MRSGLNILWILPFVSGCGLDPSPSVRNRTSVEIRDPKTVIPQLKALGTHATLGEVGAILGKEDLAGKNRPGVLDFELADGSDVVVALTNARDVLAIMREQSGGQCELILDNRPEPILGPPVFIQALSEVHLARERRAARVLENAMIAAPEITLYSVAPDSRYDVRAPGVKSITMPAWKEGAWTITGEATLRDKGAIALLASSLRNNIEGSEFGAAMCFRPRHALRFMRGETEVTILVCFECTQCDVAGFKEREAEPYFNLAHDSAAAKTWNQIYQEAGLVIQVDPAAGIAQ